MSTISVVWKLKQEDVECYCQSELQRLFMIGLGYLARHCVKTKPKPNMTIKKFPLFKKKYLFKI